MTLMIKSLHCSRCILHNPALQRWSADSLIRETTGNDALRGKRQSGARQRRLGRVWRENLSVAPLLQAWGVEMKCGLVCPRLVVSLPVPSVAPSGSSSVCLWQDACEEGLSGRRRGQRSTITCCCSYRRRRARRQMFLCSCQLLTCALLSRLLLKC